MLLQYSFGFWRNGNELFVVLLSKGGLYISWCCFG